MPDTCTDPQYRPSQGSALNADTMNNEPAIPYSLVIPAYNEEHRIRPLFDAIGSFKGELIVVCDGTDGTARVVGEIARSRADLTIRCLSFSHRLGKGGGVVAGLNASRAALVGFFDADGSTTISEMMRLFTFLAENDCAIGSRWAHGSALIVRQGILRRAGSRGFNLLIRCLFGLSFHDTQCGAKVFRKDTLDRVIPAMKSRGFEFDVELLWRLRQAGCRIVEVPIEWQNKGDSRVRMGDMVRMVQSLLMVRLGLSPV